MLTLIAGVILVGLAIVVAVSTANPIAAIPLLFLGGCLTVAGAFAVKGGIGHAIEGFITIGRRTCSHCKQLTPRNVEVCRHCGAREP